MSELKIELKSKEQIQIDALREAFLEQNKIIRQLAETVFDLEAKVGLMQKLMDAKDERVILLLKQEIAKATIVPMKVY